MVLLSSVLDTNHTEWALLVIPLQTQMHKANTVKASGIQVYLPKLEVDQGSYE